MNRYRAEDLRLELVRHVGAYMRTALLDDLLRTNLGPNAQFANAARDGVLKHFGDTNPETSETDYIKHLDRLGFEQIADFAMRGGGRTLAFGRSSGCLLAVMTIGLNASPTLSISGRHLPLPDRSWNSLRFYEESASLAGGAIQFGFSGRSGLVARMYCLEKEVSLLDAWWALDDAGVAHYSRDVATDLVTQQDRKQCRTYDEIVEMREERRNALPSRWFDLFDAGNARRFQDTHPSWAMGSCDRGL